MKAIIPVAGIGTRLRPHTHTQPKALVPVAGKAILLHIVDMLIENDVKDFVFIVGYMGIKIRKFILSHYKDKGLNIEFVVQEPREGIGHALYVARDTFRNEQNVLIILGDTIVQLNLGEFMESKHSVLGVRKVNTPGQFGIAELNSKGFIKKVVEKPKIPKSNLALVGFYKISDPLKLVEALEHIVDNNIKTIGEYQLTDALMYMIEQGHLMTTMPVDNWFDCGKRQSLLDANAILLGRNYKKSPLPKKYPNTIIIPPVSIGQNCKITNSIIGPNVAIGDDTVVTYSIVEDTIVGSYSELKNVMLNHSIVGND
ncbi:sugar phosphate nucleotidyltransferase, partial [Nafulsella turpanensis]|uniref:sugar phosphate nucleotidyltransferase n=1 Tax=Nafulsella turpanensis TaxID=1265690 RepID=UPI000366C60C